MQTEEVDNQSGEAAVVVGAAYSCPWQRVCQMASSQQDILVVVAADKLEELEWVAAVAVHSTQSSPPCC